MFFSFHLTMVFCSTRQNVETRKLAKSHLFSQILHDALHTGIMVLTSLVIFFIYKTIDCMQTLEQTLFNKMLKIVKRCLTNIGIRPRIQTQHHCFTFVHTDDEMTSQNLWSRYDRHCVGITWHNVWS